MRYSFRARGLLVTDDLRTFVERRVQFAFARFGDELAGVSVLLEDVNGPRGGADKRCRVTVKGPRVGELIVTDTQPGEQAAVDLALSRAARTVRRIILKARERGDVLRMSRARVS